MYREILLPTLDARQVPDRDAETLRELRARRASALAELRDAKSDVLQEPFRILAWHATRRSCPGSGNDVLLWFGGGR